MREDIFTRIDRELAAVITRLYGEKEDSLPGETVCELSASVRRGAVCMEIPDPAVREKLLESKAVGRYPLDGLGKVLLFDGSRLYFQKMLLGELELADMFLSFPPAGELDGEQLRETALLLEKHFSHLAETQKQAVRKTLTEPLAIISGGPGTGKTTVASAVLFLMRKLLEIEAREILILAPTGKAHMRLRESLSHDAPAEVRPFLEGIDGGTIHKMLGWSKSGFAYNRERRLPHRVILLDECSMVSQSLMRDLLRAVAPDTRLILLGDEAQLASIEAGNVFSDLCEAAVKSPERGQLHGIMTTLKENFRAKSAPELIAFAEALRNGQLPENRTMISSLPGKNQMKDFLGKEISVYREAVRLCADRETVGQALEVMEEFRIICAVNGTQYYGVAGVNGMILSLLGLDSDAPGVPVMIRHNDYEQGLFNGDTGIIGPDKMVWFPGRETPVVLDMLPEYDIAYAITAHKSQGSGYNEILLLLPPEEMPLLSKSLIYTAVTRARKKALICGDEAQIKALLAEPVQRCSGLTERLLERQSKSQVER